MSIPFSGVFTRSGGAISAITKQLKGVNLKGVKKISVKFDPFGNNITPTRDFLYYITAPKIVATNPSCGIKTEILCNRSDPEITFNLITGENVTFKSLNLTAVEILKLLNKHVSTKAPVEKPVVDIKTKSGKKGSSRKR